MCFHTNVIEAHHEGEIVCQDCGLVIEPIYYDSFGRGNSHMLWAMHEEHGEDEGGEGGGEEGEEPPPEEGGVEHHQERQSTSTTITPPATVTTRNILAATTVATAHELVRNVCANANISSRDVINHAIPLVDQLLLAAAMPLQTKRHATEAIVAYSIYSTCLRMGCPRLMKEVASYCGITVKQIYNVQKHLVPAGTELTICEADLVSKCCSDLAIAYKHSLIIVEIASSDRLREQVGEISSNCFIAVILYLFCKELGLSKSLDDIRATCGGISATSIFRAIRKMEKPYVERISSILS